MPLMLTEVAAGRASISDYVRWSAVNPAKVWGLFSAQGVIQPGADADIALVDLARRWTLDDAEAAVAFEDLAMARPRGLRPAGAYAGARPLCHEEPYLSGGEQGLGPFGPCHPGDAAGCRAARRPDHAGSAEVTDRGVRQMTIAARADAFVELQKHLPSSYGQGERSVAALAETNLLVAKGDFVALVGPSGCGKSTILKLVTGLIKASSGWVFVAGREVGAEPVRVGMAFQNPTMLPWLRIRDNVMLPLKIVPPFRRSSAAKRNTEFRDRVDALLKQVGLDRLCREVSMAALRRHAAARRRCAAR